MSVQVDLLRPVSDEELAALSERNPGYQFERTADGRLVVSPTGMESGRRTLEVSYQLKRWNDRARAVVVFDSSTGFRLPDGALFSPDAAWIPHERWAAVETESREKFGAFCPDAVFEVRSHTQALQDLCDKMSAYIRNGARIAVLIDPYRPAVEVYRPGSQPEVHEQAERVRLEPELTDFELDLRPIFED